MAVSDSETVMSTHGRQPGAYWHGRYDKHSAAAGNSWRRLAQRRSFRRADAHGPTRCRSFGGPAIAARGRHQRSASTATGDEQHARRIHRPTGPRPPGWNAARTSPRSSPRTAARRRPRSTTARSRSSRPAATAVPASVSSSASRPGSPTPPTSPRTGCSPRPRVAAAAAAGIVDRARRWSTSTASRRRAPNVVRDLSGRRRQGPQGRAPARRRRGGPRHRRAPITQVAARYADSRRQILVANSDGTLAGDDQVKTLFSVSAVASGDTGMQTGRESIGRTDRLRALRRQRRRRPGAPRRAAGDHQAARPVPRRRAR